MAEYRIGPSSCSAAPAVFALDLSSPLGCLAIYGRRSPDGWSVRFEAIWFRRGEIHRPNHRRIHAGVERTRGSPIAAHAGFMTELVDTWLHFHGRPIYGRTSRSGAHPDRPTIILVHGLVVSGRYLVPLADALSGSFDVHVPDLPGFGRSPGPKEPLELADLADALIGWMDAARVSDAVLVASSFGCQIAIEAALRHPDRVTKLVLQGPSTDARARTAMAQLKRFTKNAVHESPALYPLVLVDYLKTTKRRVLKTFRSAVRDPIEEKLAGVLAPTLIISAEKDPISPPDWCRRIALGMRDAEHVEVEAASHTLVFKEPKLVARLIRHFVLGERFEGTPPVRVFLGDPAVPEFVADLDSSAAMLRATARGLHEEAFENACRSRTTSMIRRVLRAPAQREPMRPRRLDRVEVDQFRKWVVDSYPARNHRALFLGSSNGAIAHLATAMGAPWLPQSFLLPVKHAPGKETDLVAEMEWGRKIAAPLLAANPDISLIHVHDPHREHQSANGTTVFRLKLRELGTIYRTFIHRYLEPGGTIYVIDCAKKWPQVKLSDRHSFQPGTLRGTAPSELVARGIRAPDPDFMGPEAEWGFDPAIMEDVLELAQKRNYRVVRIGYEEPDDLSPMVADAIADWYRAMGFRDQHLLVGSFVLMDPWWAIRTSSVPFWTAFDDEVAVDRVRRYLSKSDRWRSVDLMLFSTDVDTSPAQVDRWQEIIRRAGTGALLGIDAAEHARDVEIGSHSRALRQQVARREWPLFCLEPERFEALLASESGAFQIEQLTVPPHDARTQVTMRAATHRPISLPSW